MYSINTQAVVGRKLLFSDVITRFSGSMYDARVLKHSTIYNKANDGEILNFPAKVKESLQVRPEMLPIHQASGY